MNLFDVLPQDAARKIDELGYSFLREHGYASSGARKSYKVRARLKRAMRRRGEELRHYISFDFDARATLVWFELFRFGERVAGSRGLRLLPALPEALATSLFKEDKP